MTDHYHQSRVSPYPDQNAKLTDKQRLINLEHDATTKSEWMEQLVDQNNKYADYLEERIRRERDSRQFWLDIRKRLVTAGIIGTVVIILSALGYAAQQWIKHQ